MILMAIFLGGIMASAGSMAGSAGMGALGGGIISVIYVIVALLYFFPIYYLNKFAVNVKRAISSNDSAQMTEAFRFLKSHYKFIGILMIIMLSIYALIFIISIFAGIGSVL